MHKNVLDELAAIVGKDNILTSKEELTCYSYDATNQKYLPESVIFPLNSWQISQVMICANQHRFPVIPRGAGSGGERSDDQRLFALICC